MNIKFHYFYRDGSNYKSFGAVIFRSAKEVITEEDISTWTKKIRESLFDKEFFIASQISIPDVFLWNNKRTYMEDDDHCLHTFLSLETTDEMVTDNRSFEEFLESFEAADREGWELFDPSTIFC